jgi:hypothetical protein
MNITPKLDNPKTKRRQKSQQVTNSLYINIIKLVVKQEGSAVAILHCSYLIKSQSLRKRK